MHLRCHPVRIVRYGLLLVGALALITGIWQYVTRKSQSGIVICWLLALFICYCNIYMFVLVYKCSKCVSDNLFL